MLVLWFESSVSTELPGYIANLFLNLYQDFAQILSFLRCGTQGLLVGLTLINKFHSFILQSEQANISLSENIFLKIKYPIKNKTWFNVN